MKKLLALAISLVLMLSCCSAVALEPVGNYVPVGNPDGVYKIAYVASWLGAEDFSNVTNLCPGIQIVLSVGSKAEGAVYPPHNPKAYFNEDPMYIGTAAMACIGLRWLQEHSL